MSVFQSNRVTSSFNEGGIIITCERGLLGSCAVFLGLLVVSVTGNFASAGLGCHLFACLFDFCI